MPDSGSSENVIKTVIDRERPFVTEITKEQLWREISALKELVFTRLAGVENGIEVAHNDLVRVPTDVQKQVGALKELLETKICDVTKINDEKFRNIDKKLDMLEGARVEQKKDTATAVDAALKAAKEAVTEQNASNEKAINKSEVSFTKQIDQQATNITQISKGLDEKIADIKVSIADLKLAIGSGAAGSAGKTQGTQNIIEIIKFIILIVGFVLAYFIIK